MERSGVYVCISFLNFCWLAAGEKSGALEWLRVASKSSVCICISIVYDCISFSNFFVFVFCWLAAREMSGALEWLRVTSSYLSTSPAGKD